MTVRVRSDLFIYVGTYTGGQSKGIYICRFDVRSGALAYAGTMEGVANPSFLAMDPLRHYLYAVSEVEGAQGQPRGALSAFAINAETGRLAFINEQLSHGDSPCHVSVAGGGRLVLVANYSSGSVAVFPVLENGALGEASQLVQHHGAGADPIRQEGPHAHSVTVDPTGQYALVADLGLDRIIVYRIDVERHELLANDVPWVEVQAGAGPRHLAFHPSGWYAYAINELDSTLMAFSYDGTRGVLTELQTVPTLPEGFSGENWCADVHVAPSGRFVYGSNRGHDSLAIFEIDPTTGRLALVGHEPTRGRTPRNFAIDPTGQFLLAANQDSDSIVVFSVDEHSGALTPTGQVAHVPTPVCVTMGLAAP